MKTIIFYRLNVPKQMDLIYMLTIEYLSFLNTPYQPIFRELKYSILVRVLQHPKLSNLLEI